MFTPEILAELDKITCKYDERKAALLPVLHAVQDMDQLSGMYLIITGT